MEDEGREGHRGVYSIQPGVARFERLWGRAFEVSVYCTYSRNCFLFVKSRIMMTCPPPPPLFLAASPTKVQRVSIVSTVKGGGLHTRGSYRGGRIGVEKGANCKVDLNISSFQ